jgi:DHA1 family tetracycline resistance protein-like MFS transporter
LRGLADPALAALMTRKVPPTEQGALQGASNSLLGIAGMMAPTIYTESYALFATPRLGWSVPGAPFVIAAMLLAFAAVVAAARVARMPIAPAVPVTR